MIEFWEFKQFMWIILNLRDFKSNQTNFFALKELNKIHRNWIKFKEYKSIKVKSLNSSDLIKFKKLKKRIRWIKTKFKWIHLNSPEFHNGASFHWKENLMKFKVNEFGLILKQICTCILYNLNSLNIFFNYLRK